MRKRRRNFHRECANSILQGEVRENVVQEPVMRKLDSAVHRKGIFLTVVKMLEKQWDYRFGANSY